MQAKKRLAGRATGRRMKGERAASRSSEGITLLAPWGHCVSSGGHPHHAKRLCQTKALKTNRRKWQTAYARGLAWARGVSLGAAGFRLSPAGFKLSPRALANWVRSLSSHSDCCYHRLSVATSLRSCVQRPLAEKTAGWNLQIQCSRRVVYANFATTANWLTPVLVLLRASRY